MEEFEDTKGVIRIRK